jgi:hypothetical protein
MGASLARGWRQLVVLIETNEGLPGYQAMRLERTSIAAETAFPGRLTKLLLSPASLLS